MTLLPEILVLLAAAAPGDHYVAPFSLRLMEPGSMLRADGAVAFFDSGAGNAPSAVSFLTGQWGATEHLGVFVRLGVSGAGLPDDGATGVAMTSPELGVLVSSRPAPELWVAFSYAMTLPVGDGGGDSPDPRLKNARLGGVLARAALDEAVLSPNDLGITPGIDVAWVEGGLTLQLGAKLEMLLRVRGERDQPETSRIDVVAGAFLGWFLLEELSIGAELRYRHWIRPPHDVRDSPEESALVGQASAAIGPRLHLELGGLRISPGLAYTFGLDAPMAELDYNILLIDLPISL